MTKDRTYGAFSCVYDNDWYWLHLVPNIPRPNVQYFSCLYKSHLVTYKPQLTVFVDVMTHCWWPTGLAMVPWYTWWQSTVRAVLFRTILISITSCPKHTWRTILFLYYEQILLTYWNWLCIQTTIHTVPGPFRTIPIH